MRLEQAGLVIVLYVNERKAAYIIATSVQKAKRMIIISVHMLLGSLDS